MQTKIKVQEMTASLSAAKTPSEGVAVAALSEKEQQFLFFSFLWLQFLQWELNKSDRSAHLHNIYLPSKNASYPDCIGFLLSRCSESIGKTSTRLIPSTSRLRRSLSLAVWVIKWKDNAIQKVSQTTFAAKKRKKKREKGKLRLYCQAWYCRLLHFVGYFFSFGTGSL